MKLSGSAAAARRPPAVRISCTSQSLLAVIPAEGSCGMIFLASTADYTALILAES
jgi:hypothetical protein